MNEIECEVWGMILKWLKKRKNRRLEIELRSQRRWVDLLLLHGWKQVDIRIPIKGDTWLEENYYGCGVFTEKEIELPQEPRRIVVRQ
jgi:hypothetical protein